MRPTRRRRDPYRRQILGAYKPPPDAAQPDAPTDPATARQRPTRRPDGTAGRVLPHREEPS